MFATMSNKYSIEKRDGTPFPSLIPTLYAIYYDYFKMKRQVQHLISYNTIDNTIQSLPTVRAVIKANEYPSGKYYVQEFFNETHANDYLSITVIQYKWPATVEIYFTISGNLLDPYSLKVCNFRFLSLKKVMRKTLKVR
ncbi:hypothetical protein F8M41_007746 [Gigaspora margarita]|uniref:Uncharacterized protein n=1 Tax=Gigaspora margarita TaxID=4874 RepID=A0A8H3X7J4_GIGMA|nr:hypothetical protein F8M41_007746 [Gigaspora margarita]